MLPDPVTRYGLLVSRAFLVLIFLLNGFGVIDQSRAAQEMAERGLPAGAVPFSMMGGRIAQIVAGVALLVGFWERWAALVLFLFLIPATAIAHNFWAYHGAELQAQLVNFSKNVAILGGLLFIVCREEPARVEARRERPDSP
jgi:putative oxidoreductase